MTLVNTRFGRLTVIARAEDYILPSNGEHRRRWLCNCDCSAERIVREDHLRSSAINSCGCYKRQRTSESRTTHGATKNGLRVPEYKVWDTMKQRCLNPGSGRWPDYGARGIIVCDRWMKFENFYADMGPRPSPKHSIDRIDNDGNYEPGNCKWSSRLQQANNKRCNVVLTWQGKTRTLAEWARELGVNRRTLATRYYSGWSTERIFTQAFRKSPDNR